MKNGKKLYETKWNDRWEMLKQEQKNCVLFCENENVFKVKLYLI